MELQGSSWSDALALGKCESSTRSSSGTPRWCLSPRARWRDPGHYSKGRFCEELGLSSSLCWRSGPGPSQVITICLPKFPLWFPRDVVFNLLRVVWSRCSASSGSSVLSIVLLLLPGARQDQGLPVPCLVEHRHSNFRLSFRLCWETQREKRKR